MKEKIKKAAQCLIDNGIEPDEAGIVLQDLGYIPRKGDGDMLWLDNFIRDCLIKEGKYRGERKRKLDEIIIAHKKEYRRWLKEYDKKYLYHLSDGTGYGEIVAGGGHYDSWWYKVFFPGDYFTEEDKKEFIEDNWRYAKPSQYDCTGQIFTWSIKVFNVPSGVVAYIQEAMDV